jgi:hypothetical protein
VFVPQESATSCTSTRMDVRTSRRASSSGNAPTMRRWEPRAPPHSAATTHRRRPPREAKGSEAPLVLFGFGDRLAANLRTGLPARPVPSPAPRRLSSRWMRDATGDAAARRSGRPGGRREPTSDSASCAPHALDSGLLGDDEMPRAAAPSRAITSATSPLRRASRGRYRWGGAPLDSAASVEDEPRGAFDAVVVSPSGRPADGSCVRSPSTASTIAVASSSSGVSCSPATCSRRCVRSDAAVSARARSLAWSAHHSCPDPAF